MESVDYGGSNTIAIIEKELSNALNEIIKAYLKRNKIGWTKSFSFYKIIKKYESKSQEIFNYLINNQTIQHYEVIVGVFYYKGFGVDKNENIAFEWYIKASQQNDINGHYEVGGCYYYGYGVNKNYKKAFEWYSKSANNGCAEGQNRLADCYYYGDGITQHVDKAFEWYSKAAKNENGYTF